MWKIKILLYNIGRLFKIIQETGFKTSFLKIFHYMGLGKHYLYVKYPVTANSFKVSGYSNWWKKFECGNYELNCMKYISNVLKEGQIVFDVGAWIGPYTLLCAKSVKDSGRVYAFEPDPEARRFLSRNVKMNGLSNVKIHDFAITNTRGESNLQVYGRLGDSETNLIGRQQEGISNSILVKTTTIDDFCKEQLVWPDGIKIDVEGTEALVLQGSQNTIKACRPWILVEFHGNFMSRQERIRNWSIITNSAKKVTFIEGNSSRYSYGSNMNSMPDCLYCNIFIEY